MPRHPQTIVPSFKMLRTATWSEPRAATANAALLRLMHALLCAVLFFVFGTHAQASESVALLLSEDSGPYKEYAQALDTALSHAPGHTTRVQSYVLGAHRPEEWLRTPPSVIIAVGAPALTALASKPPGIPVLAVLLARSSYYEVFFSLNKSSDSKQFSAIFFDQPWHRQLAMVKAFFPGKTRLGLLLSKSTSIEDPLLTAAKERDITLSLERASDSSQVLGALKRLLAQSDALLALPDSALYNRDTLPGILLSSYRQHVPLFGFSAAYSRAGALAALYSVPDQIAVQTADWLRTQGGHISLPTPQYPKYFSVSINAQVARSLGVAALEEHELLYKISQAQESGS